MKSSKREKRVDVPINGELHKRAAHLAVERETTIQLIVDELIEFGFKYQEILEKQNEKKTS